MEKNKHEEQKHDIEKKQEHINDKKEEIVKDDKKIEDILLEKDKKINELTDKYLRALAELDNYRKRVAKEKQEFEKNAKNEAVNTFLPVLDNLERAFLVSEQSKDIESLKKGLEMIIKQFNDILKEIGVKEIETKGLFNPEYHHVLHKEYVEGKTDGEILEVYQKGYMLGDRIIRPAMVKVATVSEQKNNLEEKQKENK